MRSTTTTGNPLAMDRAALLAIFLCLTTVWGSPIQTENWDEQEEVDEVNKLSDEIDDVLALVNENQDVEDNWIEQIDSAVEPRAADEPLENAVESEAESLLSENPEDSLTYAKRKLIRKTPKKTKKGKKKSRKSKKSKKGTRKLKPGRRGGRQINLSHEETVEKQHDEDADEASVIHAFEDRKNGVGSQEKRKRRKKRVNASKRTCALKRVKANGNITDDDG